MSTWLQLLAMMAVSMAGVIGGLLLIEAVVETVRAW
jgi:hypothetical protein